MCKQGLDEEKSRELFRRRRMTTEKIDATDLIEELLERIGSLSKQNTMLEIRLANALRGVDDGGNSVPADELDK